MHPHQPVSDFNHGWITSGIKNEVPTIPISSPLSPFFAAQVAMHISYPGLLFTTTTTSLLSSIKSSSTYISYLTANIFQSPVPTLHYNVHLSPVSASLLDFVVAPHDSLPLLLPCKYVCCLDNMSWIQCISHTTRKLNIIYIFSNAPTVESVCQNHPAKSSSTFASSIAVIINIIIIIAEQEIIIHIYPPALSNTIISPGRIKPTTTISYSYPSQQAFSIVAHLHPQTHPAISSRPPLASSTCSASRIALHSVPCLSIHLSIGFNKPVWHWIYRGFALRANIDNS